MKVKYKIFILVMFTIFLTGFTETKSPQINHVIQPPIQMVSPTPLDGMVMDIEFPEVGFTAEKYHEFVTYKIEDRVEWGDLRIKSNISKQKANELLVGNLSGYGDFFIKAEGKYGVNAIFLIALARLESGNGTYPLMEYNNIFSFGAFDDDIYKAIKFESIEECILFVAEYISNEYLSEDGKWFNGYSIEDINKKYATDTNWANKIKGMF